MISEFSACAKVLSARGTRALLLAAGFEFEQSSGIFLLPEKFDRGRLEHCQLVVGGVIDAKMAQMAAKSAAEREARLAEVRRENAERQARLAHCGRRPRATKWHGVIRGGNPLRFLGRRTGVRWGAYHLGDDSYYMILADHIYWNVAEVTA